MVIAVSKFALLETTPVNEEQADAVRDVEQALPSTEPKPDSKEMREIYLPDGRLIITTRQEE